MSEVRTSYEEIARVYDSIGQGDTGLELWLSLCKRPWWSILSCESRLLDLACGTGLALEQWGSMARSGVGIDISWNMVRIAKDRCSGLDTIGIVQGDMTAIPISGEFDLITCMFNSLHHVSEPDELHKCFLGVSRLLSDTGVFCFDINTEHHFESSWSGAVWTLHGENEAVRISPRYDRLSRVGTLWVACSDLQLTDAAGEQWRCQVSFRAFSECEIRSGLQRAGLAVLEAIDVPNGGPVTPGSRRILYVCRRIST